MCTHAHTHIPTSTTTHPTKVNTYARERTHIRTATFLYFLNQFGNVLDIVSDLVCGFVDMQAALGLVEMCFMCVCLYSLCAIENNKKKSLTLPFLVIKLF